MRIHTVSFTNTGAVGTSAICQSQAMSTLLVITKGYGVLVTTMEGQNSFAPKICFPLVSHDRWSKHA